MRDGSASFSADTPPFSNLIAINCPICRLLIAIIRFENGGMSAEKQALPFHICVHYFSKHNVQYGTALWQVADSSDHNDKFKMLLNEKKQELEKTA